MPIRILERPESSWGDYGDILRHGMAAHLDLTPEGLIQLERTGPYVPPISFPGFEIVATDECRRRLEASELKGLAFKPVRKARIVELPWHTWDLAAEEPPEYPESGEPEDYVLDREHSPALAEEMGPLWQLVLTEGVETEWEPTEDRWNDRIYVRTATWTGVDMFHATGAGYVFVSEARRLGSQRSSENMWHFGTACCGNAA